MRIADAGGERGLIARIIRAPRGRHVRVGPGDDAAVVTPAGGLELLTTDTMVEGEHFNLEHFTLRQVGRKAMETNVSDIAAMCGEPRHALVAITLPADTTVEAVEELYAGIYESADRHGVDVVGGDTTRGPLLVITVTLSGVTSEDRLALRGGARPGDILMVSGSLGASEGGLRLLAAGAAGHDAVKRRHLEPAARLDIARALAGRVTAMEDVSDGLAAEVRNICSASAVGALIRARDIPIEESVRAAASALGCDPLDWALYGGEDYELVYAAPSRLARNLPGTAVGIVTLDRSLRLVREGAEEPLVRSGWDPFLA